MGDTCTVLVVGRNGEDAGNTEECGAGIFAVGPVEVVGDGELWDVSDEQGEKEEQE